MIGLAASDAAAPAARLGKPAPWDEAWFRGFHGRTAGALQRYLRHLCGGDAVADDFVQEAYLRLLGGRFRSDVDEEARAYLFRIALNLVRDRHRRRRPEVEIEQAETREAVGFDSSPTGALSGARIDVERVLRRLRERERSLLWLAHVECWSHREIGVMMNVREASVRPLLHRARRRFMAEAAALGWPDELFPGS